MKKARFIVKALTYKGADLTKEIDFERSENFFLIETLRDLDEALDTDAQLPILQVADELPPLLPSHEYYQSHKRDFPQGGTPLSA